MSCMCIYIIMDCMSVGGWCITRPGGVRGTKGKGGWVCSIWLVATCVSYNLDMHVMSVFIIH